MAPRYPTALRTQRPNVIDRAGRPCASLAPRRGPSDHPGSRDAGGSDATERMAHARAVEGLGLAQGPRGRRRRRSAMLGAEADPECWVVWGDDPGVRYIILVADRRAASSRSTSGSTSPGEGPRAGGKVVRWNRVQLGELAVEIQGGHRLVTLPGRDPGPQRRRRHGRRHRGLRPGALRGGRRPARARTPRRPHRPAPRPARRGRAERPRARPGQGPPAGATATAAPPDATGRLEGIVTPDRVRHLRPRRRPRRLGDLVGRGPRGVRGGARPDVDRRRPGRGDGRQLGGLGADHARAPATSTCPTPTIERAIVDGVVARYRTEGAPRIDGAVEAVRRIAADRPVALASSAHRAVIDAALDATGLAGRLRGRRLVRRGRPRQAGARRLPRGGPAARRATRPPASSSRTRSTASGPAKAAGMTVVLVPNASVPPAAGDGGAGRPRPRSPGRPGSGPDRRAAPAIGRRR